MLPRNLLDKTYRVLHYFILEILCPKSGTKSNVSNFDNFLLWAIEKNHHINLGYHLIPKMISTLHKASSHLYYSTVIIRIYWHFGKDCSREKGLFVSIRSIINADWAKNLTFSFHEHLPSPKTSLKSSS